VESRVEWGEADRILQWKAEASLGGIRAAVPRPGGPSPKAATTSDGDEDELLPLDDAQAWRCHAQD
jgi:hypothetical protein